MPTDVPATDFLLARMIAAIGGEENLRRHSSAEIHAPKNYANQGVLSDLTIQEQAPSMRNDFEVWTAAGKNIGSVRVYFDSVAGGQETTFGQDAINDEEANARARREDALHPLLDLTRLYKTVAVREAATIGEEPTWVIDLTPESGAASRLFVSQRTSLIVQRKSEGETATFDDYRDVDGELVPFHTTIHDALGETTIDVTSVRFNGIVPDSAFRARH